MPNWWVVHLITSEPLNWESITFSATTSLMMDLWTNGKFRWVEYNSTIRNRLSREKTLGQRQTWAADHESGFDDVSACPYYKHCVLLNKLLQGNLLCMSTLNCFARPKYDSYQNENSWNELLVDQILIHTHSNLRSWFKLTSHVFVKVVECLPILQ